MIPAYQVEDWIERCLSSILGQNVRPDEVVVVDDGSTDATAQIARGHPEVTLVQQENRGVSAAINMGARAAEADWLLIFAADDILLPRAIESLHAAISQWWKASVINLAFETEDPDGLIVRPPERPARVYRRRDLARVIRRNPLTGSALIKREVATSYPFDESLRSAEDLDLWIRLLLDSHEIVQMGAPTMRRTVARPGAATTNVIGMRRSRHRVFTRLWKERQLSVAERMVLVYQIPRVSAGIAVARARRGP